MVQLACTSFLKWQVPVYMMTFPELLSNSEWTSGPLTRRLQQNGIRLLTIPKEDRRTAKILQLCQQHCSMQLLVCTSARVQYVYYTKYAYCTGAYVSSLYIALSAPLMTTPAMVQKYILVVWQQILSNSQNIVAVAVTVKAHQGWRKCSGRSGHGQTNVSSEICHQARQKNPWPFDDLKGYSLKTSASLPITITHFAINCPTQ